MQERTALPLALDAEALERKLLKNNMKPEEIKKLIQETNPKLDDNPALLMAIDMTINALKLTTKKDKQLIRSLCDMIFSGGKVSATESLLKIQKLIFAEADTKN